MTILAKFRGTLVLKIKTMYYIAFLFGESLLSACIDPAPDLFSAGRRLPSLVIEDTGLGADICPMNPNLALEFLGPCWLVLLETCGAFQLRPND